MCHCHGHSCGSSGGCGCQSKSCSCSCHHSQCGCQVSHSCGCHEKSCGCHSKGCGCNYATKFLELADQAWMELLKEKIKEHIQSQPQHMDELARIISEANHDRWQKKMENKECCGGYEHKLEEFFSEACSLRKQKNNK